MWICVYVLYYVKVCSFYSHFFSFLKSWKHVSCQMLFLHLFRWSYDVYHSINMVYHVHWFVYIEISLQLRNTSQVVMMYIPLKVLLKSFYWYLYDFYIFITRDIGLRLQSSFIIMSLSGLVSGQCWPCIMSLEMFLPLHISGNTWKRLVLIIL